jgi:glutaredoxin
MKYKYLVGAALLLLAGAATAQVFKWVDAKGVTHFGDQPPPEQKNVQVKNFNASGGAAVDLPYELAEAVRAAPVTIYTTTNCPACDQARAMLQARGIPYTERSVTTAEDVERLRAAGGNDQLPFLTVGQRKLVGFEAGAWNTALTAAQYPERRALPPSYQFAKAEPAAPPPAPAAAPKAAAPQAATAPKVPPKPDFQF